MGVKEGSEHRLCFANSVGFEINARILGYV